MHPCVAELCRNFARNRHLSTNSYKSDPLLDLALRFESDSLIIYWTSMFSKRFGYDPLPKYWLLLCYAAPYTKQPTERWLSKLADGHAALLLGHYGLDIGAVHQLTFQCMSQTMQQACANLLNTQQ